MDFANWNDFRDELKEALLDIIHSSTLKSLYLDGVVNTPMTLFLGIVHFTKLELHSIMPDFNGERSSSLTPITSKGLATTASHPVIDQCVWHPDLGLSALPNGPIFLPFLCHLRFFEVNIEASPVTLRGLDFLSFLIRSLRITLTSPATLEHLKFQIAFQGSDYYFYYNGFYGRLCDADVWGDLDSIITQPIGSRLQRVDINIPYTFHYSDDMMEPYGAADLIDRAVTGGLPLLSGKGILFVKVFWRE